MASFPFKNAHFSYPRSFRTEFENENENENENLAVDC